MENLRDVDRCWIGHLLLDVGDEFDGNLIDAMVYNCETEDLTIRFDNSEERVINLSPSSIGLDQEVTIEFSDDNLDYDDEEDL